MGKEVKECWYAGTCVVCGKSYPKGSRIWHIERGKASHWDCRDSAPQPGASSSTPTDRREYLFADREGRSKFDQLFFNSPAEMLEKAFELSAEFKQPVGVSRVEDGKLVSLFMISALPNATLHPVTQPEVTKIDGPLFEWTGSGLPF